MTKANCIQTADIDQAEIIPISEKIHLSAACKKRLGKNQETAEDYMWLIKFAEMEHDPIAVKEIYTEVLYQRKKARGENPEDFIVPLMRVMRDHHLPYYLKAKKFIENKYNDLFPNQEPIIAPETLAMLKKLAEGGKNEKGN